MGALTIAPLLKRLDAAAIELAVTQEGRVVVRGPRAALRGDLRAAIAAHKEDLLGHLARHDLPPGQGVFDSDAIRSALAAEFANHSKRDEILRQYSARAERSLVAQYGDRLGPGERAWQAAWEIRIIYGMPVPTLARRPGSDHR